MRAIPLTRHVSLTSRCNCASNNGIALEQHGIEINHVSVLKQVMSQIHQGFTSHMWRKESWPTCSQEKERTLKLSAQNNVDTSCPTNEHYSATHYNILQRTAPHYHAPQHTATHCNILQHTATHCNTLQHSSVITSCLHMKKTLRHAAIRCNTLHHTAHTATHCTTLPHTATHCSTLQHTATQLSQHVISHI